MGQHVLQHLLDNGANCCCPATVSVLLEAGTVSTLPDSEGRIPRDVIGMDLDLGGQVQRDRGEEVAVRRILERAPAYRARSWVWPTEEASGDSYGGGGAILSSAPVPKAPVCGGIFRPKSDRKFFVKLVARWVLLFVFLRRRLGDMMNHDSTCISVHRVENYARVVFIFLSSYY